MKRYYFEPGAVQCFRKRGVVSRLARGAQVCHGLWLAGQKAWSVDSLGKFVLQLCMVAALSACLGMVAGYVDFVLAMGVFR